MPAETNEDPAFMYVYRLTDNDDEDHPVYLIQLKPSESVEDALTNSMIDILGKPPLRVPPKPGTSFIDWRVKSYLAFVLVSETQEIRKVHFKHNCKHHPHFKEVKRVEGTGWTAEIYENKRLKHDGSKLDPPPGETVDWEMEHGRKGAAGSVKAHNSSDTNVGP